MTAGRMSIPLPTATRCLAGLALALLVHSELRAQPQHDAILQAAKRAVEKNRLVGTKTLGSSFKPAFKSVPGRGGVLIGFDLGVGKSFRQEKIYAIRPVYLTEQGQRHYGEHGRFLNRFKDGKVIKSKVTRTERLRAKPGYAVGGIRVQSGLGLQAMSVVYMRIRNSRLDPAQSYASKWIGHHTGRLVKAVGTGGWPVVGVHGTASSDQIYSLGLVYVLPTVVRARPEPPEPPGPPLPPPLDPVPEPDETAREIPVLPEEGGEAKENAKKGQSKALLSNRLLMVLIMGAVFLAVAVLAFLILYLVGRKREVLPEVRPARNRAGGPDGTDIYEDTRKALSQIGIASADPKSSFFTGRAVFALKPSQMFRFYMLQDELLVLYAGPQDIKTVAAAGGLLGGVSGAMGKGRRSEADHRKEILDDSDIKQLCRFAEDDRHSFRASLSDLSNARLERPTARHVIMHAGHKPLGLFCFTHAAQGKFVVELLDGMAVQTAVAELPRLFGDDIRVDPAWDNNHHRSDQPVPVTDKPPTGNGQSASSRPKGNGSPGVYVHRGCGTETVMPQSVMNNYLADPYFYFMSATICSQCGQVPDSTCEWTETGETLDAYLTRLKRQKGLGYHLVSWSLYLLFAAAGAIILPLIPGEAKLSPAVTYVLGAVIGLCVGFFASRFVRLGLCKLGLI